jgi:UDP-2,3-diacylglucosamine pyrophosphatase LpxH
MRESSAIGSVTAHWHRALFLSDLHLGAAGCAADRILGFLERNDADVIYLVGDILDIWDPLFLCWSPQHDRILDLLRARAARGSRLVYLTGNHDRALRREGAAALTGRYSLPVEVLDETFHRGADGRRYLVLHGDACDGRFLRMHLCTRIGSRLDGGLRLFGGLLRRLRLTVGTRRHGPVEAAICAVNALIYRGHRHETRLAELARARGADGVICGHFHIAALHDHHGIRYINCGDWVDSMTAVAEAPDGTMRLLSPSEDGQAQAREPAAAVWGGAEA